MSELSQLSDAQLQYLLNGSSAIPARPLPPLPGQNSYGQPLAAPGYNADLSQLSDAQLQAAAANTDPNMSAAEDVGRSAVTGLERAVTGLGGLGGDVQGLIGKGGAYLLSKAGLDPVLSQKVVSLVQNLGTSEHGLSGTHGAGGPATTADLDRTVQGLLGPYHTPQTKAGDYAERIAEFAPAAVAPESLPSRLAQVVVPAVGSRAAEDAAPARLKPAAALAGALLGGGGVGAVERLGRAPQAAFGAAMAGVTPEQMAAAQALRQRMAALGLQLTVPEAVQQVTQNGTGLGRLQRVVESTRQGQALTAPYFAGRPGQVDAAVRNFADQIAPASDQPGMIGQRANMAATGALDSARKVVNKVADPDYAALTGQEMDPEQYASLAGNPSYAAALADLRSHPELGAAVAGLPDNNLAVINEVQKRLATMAETAAGTPLVPGDNHLAALRTQAQMLADTLARDASEGGYGGEYGRARDTVADLSRAYVDPLKAGPLGPISKTQDVGAQTRALYPSVPPEGAPNETAQAVRVMDATAPGVAADLTRQHLVTALNESLSGLQGGQNQYAGAKLAVALAGNPEQAATLRAGVSALPHGAERAQEMAELLEGLAATGKRQPPGSMTAFNESDLKDLHIAPFAQALSRLGDPLTWGAGIGDILNRANYRRNVSGLADMLMAPPEETAAVLSRAARAAKRGSHPLASALLMGRDPQQ